MDLCSNGHDEVCYLGKRCPVCSVIEEKKELEEKIEDLNSQVNDLIDEIQSHN